MSAQINFPFGKEVKSYNVEAIETPFKKNGQTFDYILGEKIKYSYFWRLVCFLSMIINFLMIIIILGLFSSSPDQIYTIALNERGFPLQIGLLKNRYIIPITGYEKTFNEILMESVKLKKSGIIRFVSLDAYKKISAFLGKDNKKFEINHFELKNGGNFSANIKISGKNFYITGTFEKSIFISPELISINPYGIYLASIKISNEKF